MWFPRRKCTRNTITLAYHMVHPIIGDNDASSYTRVCTMYYVLSHISIVRNREVKWCKYTYGPRQETAETKTMKRRAIQTNICVSLYRQSLLRTYIHSQFSWTIRRAKETNCCRTARVQPNKTHRGNDVNVVRIRSSEWVCVCLAWLHAPQTKCWRAMLCTGMGLCLCEWASVCVWLKCCCDSVRLSNSIHRHNIQYTIERRR